MVILKKAKAEDFKKIYPLLTEMNDTRLTKEGWKNLFINHYGGEEDYFGYVAYDQEEAVGFLGLIFSSRLINGKLYKFCNTSTWIVKDEYRKKGIAFQLLYEVMKLKDYTITTLSPRAETIPALKKFGFKELEAKSVNILPMLSIGTFFNSCSVICGYNIIKEHLNGGDLKIYKDHIKFKCIHLLIKTREAYCYLVLTKTKRKHLPFAQLHYISNLDIFLKYISCVLIKICFRLGMFGLSVEERFLKGRKIEHSITRVMFSPKLFKSNALGKESITDNLYTELLILNP